MRTSCVLVAISALVMLLTIISIDGKFFCYRKLKKKNKCGGYLRQDKYVDIESCCSTKGQGFADKKVRLGRNRFRCIPCSEALLQTPVAQMVTDITLSTTQTTTTTTASTTEFSWPVPAMRDNGVYSEDQSSKTDNGQVIVWEEWSPCSVSCGAGWRSRAKLCESCDRNDYENVQSQPCMVNFYCPVDGNWGPWYPWEACSSTCDGGKRIRQRKCNYPPPAYGGNNCHGDGVAEQECNKKSCPVDGNWSEWTEFSECSSTCGAGVSKRTRLCDSPLPQFGGKNCPGSEIFSKKCEHVKCPVNGGWSLWTTWTSCTATCGEGIRERRRACDSPRPQFDGLECEGSTVQQEACSRGQDCPVDGNWSPWANVGVCRAARCGRGHQLRSRTCSDPAPAHGGKRCLGQHSERVVCHYDHNCPKNGSWCEWTEWNACSASCSEDSPIQGRERKCSCPAASNGGFECQGENFQVQECKNILSCNIHEEPQSVEDERSFEDSYEDEVINISTEKPKTEQNKKSQQKDKTIDDVDTAQNKHSSL